MQYAKVNRNAVRAVCACVVLVAVAFMGIAAVAKSTGSVFNISTSMPATVYQAGHGQLGTIARVCAPIPNRNLQRGFCPDGSMPLLKRVVATHGDSVNITDAGVLINGRPLPDSKPSIAGSHGQLLPKLRGTIVVRDGEVWLSGEHINSFDSRYFGAVALTSLIGN